MQKKAGNISKQIFIDGLANVAQLTGLMGRWQILVQIRK